MIPSRSLWRDFIPEQALNHPFLLHGQLALSALHLAYLTPRKRTSYIRTYDKHQAIALTKFRTMLSTNIDQKRANAFVALAATLSVSSTARSCVVPEAMSCSGAISMDDIAELFLLTRGVCEIMIVARGHILNGPMAELLIGNNYPEWTTVILPTYVFDRLGVLRDMVTPCKLNSEPLNHCRSALDELEAIYQNIRYWACHNGGVKIGHVWQWQVKVPAGYFGLIQTRSPPALIILAHYAAALSTIQNVWFTQHWAEYAIRGISLELPASMQHRLSWPSQQVQDGLGVLGVTMPDPIAKSIRLYIGF